MTTNSCITEKSHPSMVTTSPKQQRWSSPFGWPFSTPQDHMWLEQSNMQLVRRQVRILDDGPVTLLTLFLL